ncbi:Shikimate dehydrogenase [Phocoenobacter uteri]|uniref:Shikimate dehydrogenase (NADP(+)) n=1 Tax=Phocoenobacter uteri TaxID=146806 RepID=A0A379CBZ8_9PAST|nr:shikimate dehydrogenase [Phocoenobacter uteri]MDG6881165.1 shikimate dehydrogenase [Phocoenobacter uteri]SUB59187.1 Shikimate dehydrogenase [Phocoenobacter uteri]
MNRYAVWGNPIKHSLSPVIHQHFAKQTNKQIEYVAQQGDNTLFKQQISQFFELGAKGANITAPFKEVAFQLADEHSEYCLLAEACNTLKKLSDGRLYADNTDGMGLIFDLKRLGWLSKNQKVLILGAGGATQGVLYPLLKVQQKITIYNRTFSKAVKLSEKFAKYGNIGVNSFDELQTNSFDLIINATSAGLQGQCIVLPENLFQKNTKIYDMQYAPNMNTAFLNYAKKNKEQNIQDGLGMLVAQAGYSFYIWEQIQPEIELVLQEIRRKIDKKI